MRQERILIIDGDITLSERLKTRLEALGYLVECSQNAVEALDILQARWIDLVVLAVVLKNGMDGLQLFKEIRAKKEFSKLPIAVQSKKPAMKEAFENLGAETFFIKPYSMDIFLGEIKDILTKKALILGDEESTVKPICKILSDNDFQVDILNNPYKFYVNITSYRYSLVVLQSKSRTTLADMSISLLRESQKNSKTPVIVYVAAKDSEAAKKEAFQESTLKERCVNLGGCEFMDKGYSHKQFLEIFKKY